MTSTNSSAAAPSFGRSLSSIDPSGEARNFGTAMRQSPATSGQGVTSHVLADTNHGTGTVPLALYEEQDRGGVSQYQSISAQAEYSRFSQEELRLVDYQRGRGCDHAGVHGRRAALGFMAPVVQDGIATSRRHRNDLELLRGAATRICVGSVTCVCPSPDPDTCECSDSWYLPKALISHHSPFLKAACTRNFKERQVNCIKLPNDDPAVFALYIEWMYYGGYTNPPPELFSGDSKDTVSMDAKCWVLGDKLLSNHFKNYATGRLYATTTMFGSTVTTHDVRYVCENTAAGSKLRQFFLDYVVQHFANPLRLKGSTEEWDELLLEHSDARSLLLQSFRAAPGQHVLIKPEKDYMDGDAPLLSVFANMRIRESMS